MKKMIIQKYLIAGGNSTLLVWNCSRGKRNQVIKAYLGDVEQIGFVSYRNNAPFLEMMGGELCINALIALASASGSKGTIGTNVVNKPISYQSSDITKITLELPYRKLKNIVLFDGIGYKITSQSIPVTKKLVSQLCVKFNLPAFGIVLVKKNQITPYVYVRDTDSLFNETACGSGSIATNIVLGVTNVIQPTTKAISIWKKKDVFTIETTVETYK